MTPLYCAIPSMRCRCQQGCIWPCNDRTSLQVLSPNAGSPWLILGFDAQAGQGRSGTKGSTGSHHLGRPVATNSSGNTSRVRHVVWSCQGSCGSATSAVQAVEANVGPDAPCSRCCRRQYCRLGKHKSIKAQTMTISCQRRV